MNLPLVLTIGLITLTASAALPFYESDTPIERPHACVGVQMSDGEHIHEEAGACVEGLDQAGPILDSASSHVPAVDFHVPKDIVPDPYVGPPAAPALGVPPS